MATKRMLVLTLLCLGFAGLSEAATVELSSQANTESDLAGYRLYRAPGQCASPGPYVTLQTVLAMKDAVTVLYTDPTVPNGLWCYYVTAYDISGNESLPSNLVQVMIDAVAPAAPVGLQLVPSVPPEDPEPDAGPVQ